MAKQVLYYPIPWHAERVDLNNPICDARGLQPHELYAES